MNVVVFQRNSSICQAINVWGSNFAPMIADVTVAKVVSYDKEDVWLFAAESFINQSNANEEKKDKKSSDAMSHAPRFHKKSEGLVCGRKACTGRRKFHNGGKGKTNRVP